MTVQLPEINFLSTDPQQLSQDVIRSYEQLEGRKLAEADPLHLILLALSSVITKQNIAINDAAKQNLLYYARDKVLEHKGYEWDTPRLEETASTTVLRLHASEPLTNSRIIEKGALVTSSEGVVFFETKSEYVLQAGENYTDVELICTTKGPIGNGFVAGELNTLVKPLPYIASVENLTITDGGSSRELDDAYRERIHLARESLSNAGSTGAYEYFAKTASALISDVFVYMPTPGHVNISVLLQGGGLPTPEIIEAVYQTCNARNVRPLTDFLTVEEPVVIPYDLEITYFMETDAVDKAIIHSNVQRAIADYLLWQSSKIGRDINPSKLISNCIRAGAKRVDIISPAFTVVEPGQVAQLVTESVTFGGLEDD